MGMPRHYVVMEMRANLMKEERVALASAFSASHFRRVAKVAIGEPGEDFKKGVYDDLLKKKQAKATAAWKARKANKERKKMIDKRQKQLAAVKKANEEAAKKRIEEAKQKALEDAKKKAAEIAAKKEKEEAEKKAKEEAEKDGTEEKSMEVDQTGEAAGEEGEKNKEP